MCIFFFFFGSALAIHINKREIIGKFHVKTKFVLENIFKNQPSKEKSSIKRKKKKDSVIPPHTFI